MTEQHPGKGKSSGRERLIRAAQGLTKANSFDEITIEEIIKKAELSRPAFYYHFAGGKEELRAELVHRGCLSASPVQNTRQEILEAAVRVFARSGVPGATLEDIATESGVTRGTLSWHFHSKDDLLSAITTHYGPHGMLLPAIEQIDQGIQSGTWDDETIFRRLAGAFYDAFAAQSDLARLAILLIYSHPQAAHVLGERIVKGRKGITEYIRKRQEEGYFCPHIDPGLFVQVMATFFLMRAIEQGLHHVLPFVQVSREEAIDQLVSLLLYGIVQREPTPKDNVDVLGST